MKSTYHLLLLLFCPALLALGTLCAPPAAAQELTVRHVQELDFGDQIFPGIEERIAPTDPGAAEVVISGEAGRQVQVQFQLADHLQDAAGSDLNIFFPSTAAGYHRSPDGKSSAVLFDPHTGVITSLNEEGKLYLWLGASITPFPYQPGNSYSADLILDISYVN